MPNFRYKVRDRNGQAISGVIDAPTPQAAGDLLFKQGYFPIMIEESATGRSWDLSSFLSDFSKRFKKVKMEELIFFSQQLSTLYKAGLPLLTGLQSLAEQAENKRLKPVIEDVSRQVEGGSSLYEALSRHSDIFSPIYINMVRAGETSGRLGESLDRFVTLAERELKTRQKVKEAMRYPKIVILSLVIAFTVLITFVIPRFAQMFARFNTPLPLPTRIMIGINNFFHTYWYIILILFIGIPTFIRYYINTEKGKYLWDRLKTRIPIFGVLFLKIALSRFSYLFVLLNRSGVPILQTLEITSSTIDNVILSKSIMEIGQKVKEGKSLNDAMKESGRFTPLVIQMVSIGESSGTLDEMLMRVTEYYDLEVDNAIKRLSTYIEPTLTIFLGIVVLFLALAVFLPWWDMVSLFRR
ncbi:MAG: type II secretion system F family protein [Thermodesulfovibrionales bacterium]